MKTDFSSEWPTNSNLGKTPLPLSMRVRPDMEVAPWVLREIITLEAQINRLKEENQVLRNKVMR